MSYAIEVRSLRIDYDGVTAVHDLSLGIRPGQVFGFVGPNGAGKTSTIKALAGVLEPTYGEIIIDGHDLDTEREKALARVGYMPDFPPVYENLKVWEYLDVFAAAYGIVAADRRQKVAEWLKKSSLEGKKDEPVKNLSRGMRQRLVLVKTLLPGPRALLLDEPASGLDPISRKDMRELIKAAAQEGAAVLLSSHILTELNQFCDAIGILEKGKMVISGTMEEIQAQIGSPLKLEVRLLDPMHVETLKAVMTLNGIPVETLTSHSERFLVPFSGGEREAAIFLEQLIARGAAVTGFSLQKDDIEDIFFKIGAKEVS